MPKQYKSRTKSPKVETKYHDTKVLHEKVINDYKKSQIPKKVPKMSEIFDITA